MSVLIGQAAFRRVSTPGNEEFLEATAVAEALGIEVSIFTETGPRFCVEKGPRRRP